MSQPSHKRAAHSITSPAAKRKRTDAEDASDSDASPRRNGLKTSPAAAEQPQNGDSKASPDAEAPIKLCQEQEDLVQLALEGENIFYTGAAGTGKSAVLHALVSRLEDQGKCVHVVASTGKAALNVGGTTTYAYLGIGLGMNKQRLDRSEQLARKGEVQERLIDTDVLIIDEVSMVENHHFERIDRMLKAARNDLKPFGGVQVIVTGDFCQLPPVRPFQNCVWCGFNIKKIGRTWKCPHGKDDHDQEWHEGDQWAFRSHAWRNAGFKNVYLQTIHRQRDPRFVQLLNRCRVGHTLTDTDMTLLSKRGDPKDPAYQSAVVIMCKNDDVDRVNRAMFNQLDRASHHEYLCNDHFEWKREGMRLGELTRIVQDKDGNEILHELRDHRLTSKLELRIGTVVALISNLDIDAGLCNGSQGRVVGFEKHDMKKFGNLRKEVGRTKAEGIQTFISQFNPSKLEYPIVEFSAAHGRASVRRTIYPECFINEKLDTGSHLLLCRTQIPLMQAWAMTIHRAQGMTLDSVRVDLSKLWEKGHVYVALSRATNVTHLWLEGDTRKVRNGTGSDLTVVEFLRTAEWYSGNPVEFN